MECIVERLQVGIHLFFHVAGQVAELFAGFYCGSAEYEALDLSVFEGSQGEGNGRVCFPGACRAYGYGEVVVGEGFYQTALARGAWGDGMAVSGVHDDVGGAVCAGFGAFGGVEVVDDVCRAEASGLGAVVVKGLEEAGKGVDCGLWADDAYVGVACVDV